MYIQHLIHTAKYEMAKTKGGFIKAPYFSVCTSAEVKLVTETEHRGGQMLKVLTPGSAELPQAWD